MPLTRIKLNEVLGKTRNALLPALIYASLAVIFDYGVLEKWLHVEDAEISVLAKFYDLVPSTNYIPHLPIHTVILELGSAEHEPKIADNVCIYRAHVADALDVAAALRPHGVIVDMMFPKNVPCPAEDTRLRASAQSLLGVSSVYFGSTINSSWTDMEPVIQPCLEVKTGTEIGTVCQGAYTGGVGLIDFPADRRQLKLSYSPGGIPYATLTTAAAMGVRAAELKRLSAIEVGLKNKRLFHFAIEKTAWRTGERFFNWEQFQTLKLGGPVSNNWLLIGSSEDIPGAARSEDNTPGYYHQASAFEALMTGGVLKPISWVAEWVVAFLFWMSVEFFGGILEAAGKRRVAAGGASIWRLYSLARVAVALASLIVLLMVAWWTLYLLHYYGDFALVSLVGMVMVVLETLNHWLDELRHKLSGVHP